MQQEYKIGQNVFCSGKKCTVIATKEEPYKPVIDPYNRSNIFPTNDYLIFVLKSLEPLEYSGILDVKENQIENESWN